DVGHPEREVAERGEHAAEDDRVAEHLQDVAAPRQDEILLRDPFPRVQRVRVDAYRRAVPALRVLGRIEELPQRLPRGVFVGGHSRPRERVEELIVLRWLSEWHLPLTIGRASTGAG